MISKEKKQAIMAEYARTEGDTGSPEVQVAVLKSVQVKANDINKDIRGKSEQEISRIMDTIKSELGEKFQKAAYTVTTDSVTGEIIYNFEILEAIEVDYKNLIQKYTIAQMIK